MLWKDTRGKTTRFLELGVGDVFEAECYGNEEENDIEVILIKINQYAAFDICNNSCVDYKNHLADTVSPRKATLVLE